MNNKKTLTNIPDSEVNQIVEDFESEGCQVEKKKKYSGKWTVVVNCSKNEFSDQKCCGYLKKYKREEHRH